jgi:hypothetical protein
LSPVHVVVKTMNETPTDDVQDGIGNQGLAGQDKRQPDLRNPAAEPLETPEGLKRERLGPLDKNLGRGTEP